MFDTHFRAFHNETQFRKVRAQKYFCHLHCIIYTRYATRKFSLYAILANAIHLSLCAIPHPWGLQWSEERCRKSFARYVNYHQAITSIKVSTLVLRSRNNSRKKAAKRFFSTINIRRIYCSIARFA